MPATVEVRFKGNRKDFFLWPNEAEPPRLGDRLEDRGQGLGIIPRQAAP